MLTGPNIRSLRPHVGPVRKRVYSPRSEGLRDTGPLFGNPILILGRPARPMAGLVLRTHGPRMVRRGPEIPDFYTQPPGIRPLNPLRKSKVQYGRIHAHARNTGSGKSNLHHTESLRDMAPMIHGNPRLFPFPPGNPIQTEREGGNGHPARGVYIYLNPPSIPKGDRAPFPRRIIYHGPRNRPAKATKSPRGIRRRLNAKVPPKAV